ncbi:hypothetical protein J9253_05890 [Thiothrix litoralis]|jgi:hypothetical protein|uniref:Uncharacterized protein n=1 Tax=Thiothrix litoralis TaxID=2891210 RepID=A0ABX7WYK4_9GAMM|nr:hypothetical protein [Thiothrix litoralis]QTR47463.1 hypothetical protein J9253_05890 [Thiothrix litoralis]
MSDLPVGTWIRAVNGTVHAFSAGMVLPKGAEVFVVPEGAATPDDVAVAAEEAPAVEVKPAAGKKRAGG